MGSNPTPAACPSRKRLVEPVRTDRTSFCLASRSSAQVRPRPPNDDSNWRATGARHAELALRRDASPHVRPGAHPARPRKHVDFAAGVLRVERNYDQRHGSSSAPKSSAWSLTIYVVRSTRISVSGTAAPHARRNCLLLSPATNRGQRTHQKRHARCFATHSFPSNGRFAAETVSHTTARAHARRPERSNLHELQYAAGIPQTPESPRRRRRSASVSVLTGATRATRQSSLRVAQLVAASRRRDGRSLKGV